MKILNNYTATLMRQGSPPPHGALPLATDQPASIICFIPGSRTFIRWWPGTGLADAVQDDLRTWSEVAECYCIAYGEGEASKTASFFKVPQMTVEGWLIGSIPSEKTLREMTEIMREKRHEGK